MDIEVFLCVTHPHTAGIDVHFHHRSSPRSIQSILYTKQKRVFYITFSYFISPSFFSDILLCSIEFPYWTVKYIACKSTKEQFITDTKHVLLK